MVRMVRSTWLTAAGVPRGLVLSFDIHFNIPVPGSTVLLGFFFGAIYDNMRENSPISGLLSSICNDERIICTWSKRMRYKN